MAKPTYLNPNKKEEDKKKRQKALAKMIGKYKVMSKKY